MLIKALNFIYYFMFVGSFAFRLFLIFAFTTHSFIFALALVLFIIKFNWSGLLNFTTKLLNLRNHFSFFLNLILVANLYYFMKVIKCLINTSCLI
jgi:hypothetical protein